MTDKNDNQALLSKIEEVFANKVHKLIGDVYFSDEEYYEMVDTTGILCQNNIILESDNKLIFITLVEIAKRWGKTEDEDEDERNGGFWPYVFKTLIGWSEGNQQLYSQITSLISKIDQHCQIPVVNTGHKYYATLMMHAFSPKNSIFSFFDLCYNVFKTDLDFGFTSEDEWICEIVSLQIKNVLQNGYVENKAVSIGSSAYQIKIGLKCFALHEDLSLDFVQFIKNTFEHINKLFNRERIEGNNILQRYIVEWWKNKIEKERVTDNYNRKKRIATVTKFNISPKYIRNDKTVLLCIPPIRLDNETDIMKVSVYVNDKLSSSEEMSTKRGELVVSTKEYSFDLNNLLKYSPSIDIQVIITENGSQLYDSKETLNREFILFEDEKELFRCINKPSNYFVYSKDIEGLKSIPQELSTYYTNLYNIYPTEGESLTGNKKRVFFESKANDATDLNTICLLGNLQNVEWVLDDIHCFVYKDCVLIVPRTTNLKATEVKIDSKKTYKLNTLNNVLLENGSSMFGLLQLGLIKPNEPTELSIYSYEEEMTVLQKTLIVLPLLEIKFCSPVFYGNMERTITVCNGTSSNCHSWSNKDNDISCPLSEGEVLVKIPYIKWRIGNQEWRNEPINRTIWYKNLLQNGDLLEVDSPIKDDEIKLFIKNGKQKDEIPKNKSGKFEIGRYIYGIGISRYITIDLTVGSNCYNLFTTATEEHFTENPLSYINGSVYWNIEDTFVGDKDNVFFLIIKSSKNTYRSEIDIHNCVINNLYEDICRITVKVKKNNILLKNSNYKVIFEEKAFIIGNPNQFRFKNKCLQIEFIKSLFSNDENWTKLIKDYRIYNLNFVEEKEGDETYEYYKGTLGVNSYGIITDITYMANEHNVKELINPVHIEFKNSNTFWLTAGYDNNGSFYNEQLMVDPKKELCFSNMPNNKVVNLYKFKELEQK